MTPEIAAELKRLESLCAAHDWYFDFSDDHSVWKRGQRESDAIMAIQRSMIAQGFGAEAKAVVDKYIPKG